MSSPRPAKGSGSCSGMTGQTLTATRLSRGQGWLLVMALATATLIRAYPYVGLAFPAGGDYGQHLQFAEAYRITGRVPVVNEFFQRGLTEWVVLPGAGMIYALLGSMAGRSAFDMVGVAALTGALEAAGIFLLALRLFGRPDAAVVAAVFAAVFPAGPDMIAWGGYPNLIVLALMPFTLLSWLQYWEKPTPSRLAITVLMVVGAASIHHFSTLWLGLILGLFSLATWARAPRASAGRLGIAVGVGVVVGLPVVSAAVHMATVADAAGVVLGTDPRFDVTLISWAAWDRVVSVLALALLGGVLPIVRQRFGTAPGGRMVVAHLAVCAFFGWGWLVGINFSYYRALYFLGLPTALAAAAVVVTSPPAARSLLAGMLVVTLGLGTAFRMPGATSYYSILKPNLVEGLDWLARASQPSDVVAVGSFLGFHAPRLLRRPTLVAMPPHQVGNVQEMPLAEDGMTILSGGEGFDEALDRQAVRWIVVTTNGGDTPSPEVSLDALSRSARLILVFRNDAVAVFFVRMRT